LCFMVNDKMCVGVRPNNMMVRIDPDKTELALEEEGCAPMVHGGKQMNGFIFVDESVLNTKKQLQHWIKMALEYNSIAKPSKKK
jgi:TfoX/Sxy family transcriptional regulator of competence genes